MTRAVVRYQGMVCKPCPSKGGSGTTSTTSNADTETGSLAWTSSGIGCKIAVSFGQSEA